MAQPDLAPTLAVFASRSVISTPPRFAINYSVRATLAVFAETHRLRTSDVERDQEVSRKPSVRCYTGITYSIKSVGQNKSFAPVHSADRPVDCAGSKLVVLVFEQDVERGERSVTTGDILLQVELVRFAQFAWHAVASAKAGRSRSPSARGNRNGVASKHLTFASFFEFDLLLSPGSFQPSNFLQIAFDRFEIAVAGH